MRNKNTLTPEEWRSIKEIETPNPYEQRLVVMIPAKTKVDLQVWCLQHGIHLKDIVRILIERFLKEQKSKEVKQKNE